MKLALGMTLAAAAFAQAPHRHPPADASLRALSLPAPVKIAGVGNSHLSIATNSPEAQRWFDQGLSLLHCFWDFEALRALEESARLDPDCAMCQWGVYQAIEMRGGYDAERKAARKRMEELAPKASDRERRYIHAVTAREEAKEDGKREAYTHAMEALVYAYPDDIDARLFLALSLESGFDEKDEPRSGTLYAQSILRDLMRRYPESAAAHHYWIHAVESSPHPEWAIASAEKLAALAPGSGHMVHMPGHIFYRTGDYERARQSFLAAMRVDEAYMASQKLTARDDWNYYHNISYMIANSAEEGRRSEALELAARLKPLAYDERENPNFYILQIAGTEARLYIRFGDWERVKGRPVEFGASEDKLPAYASAYRDGLGVYAGGMEALEKGDTATAETQADKLDALLWRISREKEGAEEKKDAGDAAAEAMKYGTSSVVKLLSVASKELRGNVESRENHFDRARELLEEAAKDEKKLGYAEPPRYSRPALESLGYACIRAGKFGDAREAFNKVLAERPKSGFGYYGIALAWEKEGKRAEAATAYGEFLEAWKYADRDLPQTLHAAQARAGK